MSEINNKELLPPDLFTPSQVDVVRTPANLPPPSPEMIEWARREEKILQAMQVYAPQVTNRHTRS